MFSRLLYLLDKTGLWHLFLYIGSKFKYTLIFLSRPREDRVSESFVKTLEYRGIGKRHLRIYHGVSFARLESKLRLRAQMFV